VLDPLGGADWRKGLKLLRPCGRLVAYGFANLTSGQRRRPVHVLSQVASMPRLTPLTLMNSNRSLCGVHIGRLWGQIAMLSQELGEVLALWEAGRITPRIDSTYPLDEAAEAHRRILSRQNTGKIVLTP
jgi:synaptic vesicle membrane protein VAT-1